MSKPTPHEKRAKTRQRTTPKKEAKRDGKKNALLKQTRPADTEAATATAVTLSPGAAKTSAFWSVRVLTHVAAVNLSLAITEYRILNHEAA
jgi:hypothetical protein